MATSQVIRTFTVAVRGGEAAITFYDPSDFDSKSLSAMKLTEDELESSSLQLQGIQALTVALNGARKNGLTGNVRFLCPDDLSQRANAIAADMRLGRDPIARLSGCWSWTKNTAEASDWPRALLELQNAISAAQESGLHPWFDAFGELDRFELKVCSTGKKGGVSYGAVPHGLIKAGDNLSLVSEKKAPASGRSYLVSHAFIEGTELICIGGALEKGAHKVSEDNGRFFVPRYQTAHVKTLKKLVSLTLELLPKDKKEAGIATDFHFSIAS